MAMKPRLVKRSDGRKGYEPTKRGARGQGHERRAEVAKTIAFLGHVPTLQFERDHEGEVRLATWHTHTLPGSGQLVAKLGLTRHEAQLKYGLAQLARSVLLSAEQDAWLAGNSASAMRDKLAAAWSGRKSR